MPVEPIGPQAAAAIRLSWSSRFTSSGLVRHVKSWPGYSWWNPHSGEYLIGEPWRHREEIGNVLEVSGRRSRAALVAQLAAELDANRVALLLLSESEWYGHTRLYRELGFADFRRSSTSS